MYALTRHYAHVRARQNLKMLKITFCTNESTFQVILSISKFSARTRTRARNARTQRVLTIKMSFFCMDLNYCTFLSTFTNFQFKFT